MQRGSFLCRLEAVKGVHMKTPAGEADLGSGEEEDLDVFGWTKDLGPTE